MDLLLTLDEKNYTDDMPVFETTTIRAVIERGGVYSMQCSAEGWYKIPGGGLEPGETHAQTLMREVSEEVGLRIDPESLKPLGKILELREDRKRPGTKFVRHTLYYACRTLPGSVAPHMTHSEIALGFHPVWAPLRQIIETNLALGYTDRDTDFLRLLSEGKTMN